MMAKKCMVSAELDYVQGHLRSGRLQGEVFLTDEELRKLKADPDYAKELDLTVEVTEHEVDDTGYVDSITIMEVDPDGRQTELDLSSIPSFNVSATQDCFDDDQFARPADAEFKYEVKDSPEQGTEKWLEWRKAGITATEAASIMYPSSWGGSPLKIYTDKLGLTKNDQSDSDGYMEWGHRIEDLLVQKFMECHPTFRHCTQGRLYQRDWCKCSLDAQCFDSEGKPCIVECKTGQHEDKWSPVPERYYAQVQWQMYVTGIRKAYFSVLICGHTWLEREVDFNPEYVERMLERCRHVWDCIERKEPPATLGDFESDKSAISALAGESGHQGEPLELGMDVASRYVELKEAYEKAESEFMAFKNSIGMQMVDHRCAKCEGKTFATWVERKGSETVDKELLRLKYPDVYRECLRAGVPTRYIRYTV